MYPKQTEIKKLTVKLLFVLMLSIALPASASVGKIVYGYGNNYAYDADGNRRDLKKGSKINEGDTLVTNRGRLHVRLIDGGFISVYPNSEYKIEQFKFSGKTASSKTSDKTARSKKNETIKEVAESKEDRGFFSLLKGAARQVTGLLGRTYNNNFRLKTAVATIGIRGTGFFARLCQADCFDANGNPMQDGMYIKNNTGVITMTTDAGEVSLAQGQSAFAASREDSPHQVIQPPIAYHIVTPEIELFDFDDRVVDPQNNVADNNLPNTAPPVNPPVVPPAVTAQYLTYISITDKLSSTPIYALDTADADSDVQQNGDAIESFNTVIQGDGGAEVTAFDKGTASLAESGRNDTYGVIWNRWSGNYNLTQAGSPVTSLDDNLHMIGSESLTSDATLSALTTTISYTSTGGTSPTFAGLNGNQVGTQTVTATIDYANMEVIDLTINATFVNADVSAYLLNTSGNSFVSAGNNVFLMSGFCNGSECGLSNSATMGGEASVNITGQSAEAIYGVYSLSSDSSESAVSGSYLAQ